MRYNASIVKVLSGESILNAAILKGIGDARVNTDDLDVDIVGKDLGHSAGFMCKKASSGGLSYADVSFSFMPFTDSSFSENTYIGRLLAGPGVPYEDNLYFILKLHSPSIASIFIPQGKTIQVTGFKQVQEEFKKLLSETNSGENFVSLDFELIYEPTNEDVVDYYQAALYETAPFKTDLFRSSVFHDTSTKDLFSGQERFRETKEMVFSSGDYILGG